MRCWGRSSVQTVGNVRGQETGGEGRRCSGKTNRHSGSRRHSSWGTECEIWPATFPPRALAWSLIFAEFSASVAGFARESGSLVGRCWIESHKVVPTQGDLSRPCRHRTRLCTLRSTVDAIGINAPWKLSEVLLACFLGTVAYVLYPVCSGPAWSFAGADVPAQRRICICRWDRQVAAASRRPSQTAFFVASARVPFTSSAPSSSLRARPGRFRLWDGWLSGTLLPPTDMAPPPPGARWGPPSSAGCSRVTGSLGAPVRMPRILKSIQEYLCRTSP
jgi:hypothetical protein